MSYLAMKEDSGSGASLPKIYRKCGSKALYFTDEQITLIDRVGQNAWASKLHWSSACGAGYSNYNDYQNLVASTVYYYDTGLRGRELRQQLADDYGIGILLILQFVVVIIQIIYWIRELRKQNDSNAARNTE